MFITEEQLKSRLAGMLKYDAASLPDYWTNIVTDSLFASYGNIVSAFQNRGFSISQIDAWDQGAEYQRDIGLFWCLVKGGGLHSYDPTFVKMLDRRKEMDSINLEDGGAPQEQAGAPKVVGYGRLVNDCTDVFTRDIQF